MAQVIDELEVDSEIVKTMRQLAGRGASVREMVECVQSKVSLNHDAILPVLWYFMKAFHLPLGEVLPMREWFGTANDQEIDRSILPAIQKTKARWSA